MKNKRKVLIITYYWPPSGGSGVQRWLKFAKYLPELGYKPIIYTPKNPAFQVKDSSLLNDIHPETEIIQTKIVEPFHLLSLFKKGSLENSGAGSEISGNTWKQKILKWVRGNFFIPDPRIFWVKPSVKFLIKYLKENPVDIMITTGPPHSMHLIGLGIKKQMNIKWISDFRDPFARMDVYDEYNISNSVRRKLERMEKQILDRCDILLSTSFSLDEMLVSFDKRKMVTITNGFDLEDLDNDTASEHKGIIRFLHAGTLGHARNPTGLWRALELLCKETNDLSSKLQIEFVGNTADSIIKYVSTLPQLSDSIKFTSYLSHQELAKKYKEADVLILAIHKTHVGKVCIPGKLFEYMALKKPIIAFGALDSDASRIINQYHLGYIFEYEDVINLKSVLSSLISNKYILSINNPEINKFSRRALAEELSQLLDKM